MTTTEAIAAAEKAIRDAGFNPCPYSGYIALGKAFAFSAESANGCSASGPAFEAVVAIEAGDLATYFDCSL